MIKAQPQHDATGHVLRWAGTSTDVRLRRADGVYRWYVEILTSNPIANPVAPAGLRSASGWRSRAWPVLGPEGKVRYLLYCVEEAPATGPPLPPEEEYFRGLAEP